MAMEYPPFIDDVSISTSIDMWYDMIYMIYALWYMIHDTWYMKHDTDTGIVWYGIVWMYGCMYVCNCIYNHSDRVFPSKPRLSFPKGIQMSLLRPVLPPPSWPGPAAIVDLGVTNGRWGGLSVALIITNMGIIFWLQHSVATAAAEQISTEIKLKSDSDLYFNLIYV